ncbi:hypothetical protein KOI35_16225 [Actinoplanes bogorensis]|uniref:Signal transduction histidine kinase subgroup 3 dimerisation and phosphoacceptor domain-containing protein n=1 Tax=Paractinoplanes bogorensis TaxID=1610840 RepID=A0ABS5YNL4_9ACTN|nr:histidine kinase [Actinoplanes bogorensis]MBU2665052.1 hypothetical protein [Actinoplanes bogorensis]
MDDALAQALAAVAYQGSAALRCLPHDPEAARVHLETLTEVARHALWATRPAHDGPPARLAGVLERAAALLLAAGVRTTVTDRTADGTPDRRAVVEEALVTAVREEVLNVLQRGTARRCDIEVSNQGGSVRLVMTNDGGGRPPLTVEVPR